MAHIQGVSAETAGQDVQLLYDYTRQGLAGITDHEPRGMLEPLEMYAHAPELLKAIAGLEMATAQLNRLEERLNVLAQLKAATLTSCEYCIDLGSQIARRSGLSDEQLLALPAYRSSPLFTDVEKLVLDYAVGMSRTPGRARRQTIGAPGRGPAGGAHARYRAGEHARALQPGAGDRRGGF